MNYDYLGRYSAFSRSRVEQVLRNAFEIPNDHTLSFSGGMLFVAAPDSGNTNNKGASCTDATPEPEIAARDYPPNE